MKSQDEPATEKQKDKLRFFGCTWNDCITKGQAHDAIEECVRMFPEKEKAYQERSATDAQMKKVHDFLDAYGDSLEDYLEDGEVLTYQRANEMIEDWEQEEVAAQEREELDAMESQYIIDVGDWAEIYPGLTWKRVQAAAKALDKSSAGWRDDESNRDIMLAKVAEMNPKLAERWGEGVLRNLKEHPVTVKKTEQQPINSGWYTQYCLHCGGAIELQLSGIPAGRKVTEEDMTLVSIQCPQCGSLTDVLSPLALE